MGMIKSGLIILASLILFISIFLGNIFLITSLSLDYNTINPELTKIATKIANNENSLTQKINTAYPKMTIDCENQTEIQLTNYSIPYEYLIPCSTVEKGPESIINETIQNIIKKSYNKEYDCKFSDCIKDTPLYLASNTYKNNLKSKFNKTLILSLALIIAIFFLVEKKRNSLTITGTAIILASLFLIKIDLPIKAFTKTIRLLSKINLTNDYLSELIPLLFLKTQTVFNISIAIGTMLIVLGIGLGLLKLLLNGKEKKFTKREVEEIVDKKLSKKPTTNWFSGLLKDKKASEKKV